MMVACQGGCISAGRECAGLGKRGCGQPPGFESPIEQCMSRILTCVLLQFLFITTYQLSGEGGNGDNRKIWKSFGDGCFGGCPCFCMRQNQILTSEKKSVIIICKESLTFLYCTRSPGTVTGWKGRLFYG